MVGAAGNTKIGKLISLIKLGRMQNSRELVMLKAVE